MTKPVRCMTMDSTLRTNNTIIDFSTVSQAAFHVDTLDPDNAENLIRIVCIQRQNGKRAYYLQHLITCLL